MRHSIFKTHGNNILQMRTFMSGRKLKITASWRSAAPPQIADLHDTGSWTTLLGRVLTMTALKIYKPEWPV